MKFEIQPKDETKKRIVDYDILNLPDEVTPESIVYWLLTDGDCIYARYIEEDEAKGMSRVKIEYITGKNKGKITITEPMTQPETDKFIDSLKGDDSTNTDISIINDDIEVHYQDYLSLKHRKSAK